MLGIYYSAIQGENEGQDKTGKSNKTTHLLLLKKKKKLAHF